MAVLILALDDAFGHQGKMWCVGGASLDHDDEDDGCECDGTYLLQPIVDHCSPSSKVQGCIWDILKIYTCKHHPAFNIK